MHSQFDTSLAAIDAGGLQATSRVGPAAAAVRSDSALAGALPLQCTIDACFRCVLHVCLHLKLRILNSGLINVSIFDSCIAAGLDSLFWFLFVRSAARVVVFAEPLWPVVRRGRSERCVSHQVRQDAHWLPAADYSHPGQSAVGELTFSLLP